MYKEDTIAEPRKMYFVRNCQFSKYSEDENHQSWICSPLRNCLLGDALDFITSVFEELARELEDYGFSRFRS